MHDSVDVGDTSPMVLDLPAGPFVRATAVNTVIRVGGTYDAASAAFTGGVLITANLFFERATSRPVPTTANPNPAAVTVTRIGFTNASISAGTALPNGGQNPGLKDA